MVLLLISDLGLPPLEALVLFSLHYWILTRIKRKKILKVTKPSSFLGGSSYNKEATVNDIVIAQNSDNSSSDLWRLAEKEVYELQSCLEHEIMMNNSSSTCSSLISGNEELTDKKFTAEEGVGFARNNTNLAGNGGVVIQNEEMLHQVDCALLSFDKECLDDLLYKGTSVVHESDMRFENTASPLLADVNLESLESVHTNMPQSQTRTTCINGDGEVLQIFNKSDSILSENESDVNLSKLVEGYETSDGHEAEVVGRGFLKKDSENDEDASVLEVVTDLESSQKVPSEMSFDLAKDSSAIPEHKDYKSVAG